MYSRELSFQLILYLYYYLLLLLDRESGELDASLKQVSCFIYIHFHQNWSILLYVLNQNTTISLHANNELWDSTTTAATLLVEFVTHWQENKFLARFKFWIMIRLDWLFVYLISTASFSHSLTESVSLSFFYFIH